MMYNNLKITMLVVLALFAGATINAQSSAPEDITQMIIHHKDGKVLRMNIEDIDSVTFGPAIDERYQATDLGLSVLWAASNIGADTPEDYGDYFAWGETEPKESYTEENYSYPNQPGEIDGADDGWRLPTIGEIDELASQCTWTWTALNDICGFRVTGPSGESIFLPAAGQKRGSEVINRDTGGYYWSSTPSQEYSTAAYNLNFAGYTGHWSANRSYGFTIRAVKDR